MTPEQITNWIAVAAALEQVGVTIAGKVKAFVSAIAPEQGLTEEQINAIEQAIADDAARRQAEREAMGQASE